MVSVVSEKTTCSGLTGQRRRRRRRRGEGGGSFW
jgi:hypothetical protein